MKKLLYIGNNLSKHGNNTTSIETLGLLLENEGYELYYASSKKNKIFRLLDMIITTINLRKKVDFVLIDVYSTYNFWYAFIISQLCRFFDLKYIPKLHGGNLPERFVKNPKLCTMIFDNAFVNIVPSNYLLSYCKTANYKNVLYIANTIEIDNYTFKSKEIIEPKLLWVRSFDKIYNPQMAIKVLFELKKIYPHAKLCMVGPEKDGSLASTMKNSELLNLDVKFTGKLTKPEWIDLSLDYDVFINTTHFDNTPISVIEAMALGLPVVSTNVGGLPFLLENNINALLVNDNDVNRMVKAIVFLIENKHQAKAICLNARDLTESFDWNIVKNQWFEILK
jgi:L-malate glycosyltransferase